MSYWKHLRRAGLIRVVKDVGRRYTTDNVGNGGAALAFYLLLAIFPAAIFLLSLLPYLPIPNLQQSIMSMLAQALPGQAASAFTSTVQSIVSQRRGGLLSLGAVLTLWSSSSGMYAVMRQLNFNYRIRDSRPFWKIRGIALMLTVFFSVLVIGAFALVMFGGYLIEYLSSVVGLGSQAIFGVELARWTIVALALMLGFAVTYYYGPDLTRRFAVFTPGAVTGVALLVLASLAFKFYADNFGSYQKTYGGLGAAILLMLWLNITGVVILIGSEVNAVLETYGGEASGSARGEPEPKAAA